MDAPRDVDPAESSVDALTRRLLRDARVGIHRSQRAIARTSAYLQVAQAFLAEENRGGLLNAVAPRGLPSPRALQTELDSLRSCLYRVILQVANERVDLGMEASELHRLTAELQRLALNPPSVRG